MTLLLEIDNNPNENIKFRSFQFNKKGGIVGRDAHCTWELVDSQNIISNNHAEIKYEGGEYFIVDISQNGIFYNAQNKKLPKNKMIPLRDIDILFIGKYEIKVSLKKRKNLISSKIIDRKQEYIDLKSGELDREKPLSIIYIIKKDYDESDSNNNQPIPSDYKISDIEKSPKGKEENILLSIFSEKLGIDFTRMSQEKQRETISELADIISVTIKRIEHLKNDIDMKREMIDDL